MKKQNIIAFILGLIVAGLLWQFYLKPKYLLNNGDEETWAEVYQADIAALNEATDEIEGEVLFKDYGEGAEFKDDIINNAQPKDEDFEFHSTANRQPDFFEQASREKPKDTKIIIDNEDPVMHPSAIAGEGGSEEIDSSLLPNRITMISAPVKYKVIDNQKDYQKYQSSNKGDYPKVNFKKERIVFIESDSQLSNGFFEAASYEDAPEEIIISYKVNILGADKRPERASYILVPSGTKPLTLKQIK